MQIKLFMGSFWSEAIDHSPISKWTWRLIVITSLLKLWLIAGNEINALGFAGHDDALYVKMAKSIVEGNWLGAFDQQKLIKVPFFSIFIATCYLASIPLAVGEELVNITACVLMILALRPLLKTCTSQMLLFLALLYCPTTFVQDRIVRDNLYSCLLIAFCACSFAILLRSDFRSYRLVKWLFVYGFVLGLIWITREEGVVLLPFITVTWLIIFIKHLCLVETKASAPVVLFSLGVPVFTLSFLYLGVCFLNYHYYGMFGTTEIKTKSFSRAFGTLCGVDEQEKVRYIPITLSSLEKVYAVSSAALELKPFLDGPLAGWKRPGQSLVSSEYKNEYKGDWFKWAFRDAVQMAGHYRTWQDASSFYDRLHCELIDAYNKKIINGAGDRSSSVLPIIHLKEFINPIFKSFIKGMSSLYSLSWLESNPPQITIEAGGLDPSFAELFEKMTGNPVARKRGKVSGWAFIENATSRLDVVTNTGESHSVCFASFSRPDVCRYFSRIGIPENSGFSFAYSRGDRLRLRNLNGEVLALLKIQTGGDYRRDEAGLPLIAIHIDEAVANDSRLFALKYRIQKYINSLYKASVHLAALLSIISLGLVSFFNKSRFPIVLLFACMLVIFISSRVFALAVIDASTWHALPTYLTPSVASYILLIMLPVAALLSVLPNRAK